MPPAGLTRAQVEAYVAKFETSRVCVLGDLMLDRYFWGEVDRISPEAPVPVVRVTRRSVRLGGAANVAANLQGLGVRAAVAGAIGDDRAGREITRLLEELGVDVTHVAVESGQETTEKVRIIAQSQQVVRADFEMDPRSGDGRKQEMHAALVDAAAQFDALVVSDYGKGVVQKQRLPQLICAWRIAGKPVLVDPFVPHFRWYTGATIVTPNTREAASFFDSTVDRGALFGDLGRRMRKELDLDALLITRGEDGMTLFDGDEAPCHIPTVAKEVYDVTGAGDTVIGVLGAAVACGVPLGDAVVLANQAAGEVVKEVGTSVIAADRLVRAFE